MVEGSITAIKGSVETNTIEPGLCKLSIFCLAVSEFENKFELVIRPRQVKEWMKLLSEGGYSFDLQVKSEQYKALVDRIPFAVSGSNFHELEDAHRMWIKGELNSNRALTNGFFHLILVDPNLFGIRSMLPESVLNSFWQNYFEVISNYSFSVLDRSLVQELNRIESRIAKVEQEDLELSHILSIVPEFLPEFESQEMLKDVESSVYERLNSFNLLRQKFEVLETPSSSMDSNILSFEQAD